MTQTTIEQALQIAIGHHGAGRLAEAERIYRQILAQVPDHPDALHLLGVLACQTGHADLAIDLICRAIKINPAAAAPHGNLGESYRRAGRWKEAIASLRRAIELRPDRAQAHHNLANLLKETGRAAEAIDAYRRAIGTAPDHAEAHSHLGIALHETGRFDEAIAAFRRAIAIEPGLAEAHSNLGGVLKLQGELEEASAAFRRAITIKPELAEAHNNLGVVLHDAGRHDEAIASFGRAIAGKPDHAEYHCNLGVALYDAGRPHEAIDAFRKAIQLAPDHVKAHDNLGHVLRETGRLDLALSHFRRAVELKPDCSTAASNIVFSLHFHPDYDAQAILAEHRLWASQFAAPLAAQIRPHQNDRAPDRKLRIGYVSPDFRTHPVGRLLLPLYSHHDRHQVEIVCYSDARRVDAVTEKLKATANLWRDTVRLSDQEVADRIRADRIDILVDLALHTAGNRLRVFARKPAPVQVTMLGMPATTGLATMDYRLTDRYLDPPGMTDGDYTERSIRLPHSFWCYQPPEQGPPVNDLPAWRNGYVTFGCLNQFVKVSPKALQLWIMILQALPTARLVIHAQPGSHLEELRLLFRGRRIALDRIEFSPMLPLHQYFQRYHDLDLSFDPFPFNGGTSTLDSLWMGVPVITLAGRTAVGRGGVSILSNVALPGFIAQTPDQYRDLALRWAGDLPSLGELRAGMRQRMQSSALMDGQQFAADVEAVYRRIWKTWCAA